MTVSAPGFITKVLVPQRRADVLRRPRLLDFLHQHIDRRLLLVCAPAGYGKTTVLVDFAHEVNIPVCWLTLGTADGDVRVFLEYLIAAIRQRFPSFGQQSQAVLSSTADLAKGLSAVVGTLVNEMYTAIPEYFIIVLDDFHYVDGSDQVPAAMDLLLHYLPENCHIVVAGRAIPRITLSRLAAHRQVAGLGTSDLRFTSEEIRRLLSEHYKVLLPGKTADGLAAETEGWITGIILSTQAAWQGLFESIVRAKGAGGEVFDYLANEVFAHQPADVQRFLLGSSVLEQLSPGLCAALLDDADCAAKLKHVEEANLFLTRLAGSEAWYRYHQLFRSFLENRLRDEHPAWHRELQRRAAALALEREAWDEAIAHLVRADDPEQAVGVVISHANELMDAGKLPTLARWIDFLPEAVVAASPDLLLIRGRIHFKTGEPERALEVLNEALASFDHRAERLNAARVLSVRGLVLAVRGRGAEAIADCERGLSLVGEQDMALKAEIHRNKGICHGMQGHLTDSIAELDIALQLVRSSNKHYDVATLHQSLGFANARLGDVPRARFHFDRALTIWRRLGNAAAWGETLNSLGYLLHDDGDEEGALATLGEALSKSREGSYLRIEAAALANIADVHRACGRFGEAIEHYERSLEIARRIEEGYLVGYALDGVGDTYARQGEFRRADRLIRQAIVQAEERQSPYEQGAYQTSLGMLRCDQEEPAKGLRSLLKACELLRQSGAKRELTRALMGYARALHQLGRNSEAVAQLRLALDTGAEVDYHQFLVRDGKRCLALLEFAVAHGVQDHRVADALSSPRVAGHPDRVPAAVETTLQAVVPVRLASLRAFALGQAKVLRDGREITRSGWASDKVRELFFFLLAHSYSLSKDQIVESVWPDCPPGSYNSTFHSTMYRLRRALQEECILRREGRYRLNPALECRYDVVEFESLLEEAERQPRDSDEGIAISRRAVALYQGPYLKEFGAEWCEGRRAQLAAKFLAALVKLATTLAERRQFGESIELCQRALDADNLHEDAHYVLLKSHAAQGDFAEGLRHYRHYAAFLREELGVKPAARLRALYEQLMRGDPAASALA